MTHDFKSQARELIDDNFDGDLFEFRSRFCTAIASALQAAYNQGKSEAHSSKMPSEIKIEAGCRESDCYTNDMRCGFYKGVEWLRTRLNGEVG